MTLPTASFVGIDVSKQQLDVAVRPRDETWTVAHDEAGLSALVVRLRTLAPTLIVLEATGGLEVALAGASYRGSGIPACIASGRRAAATPRPAVAGRTGPTRRRPGRTKAGTGRRRTAGG